MRLQHVGHGGLRFYGTQARELRDLVIDDPAYSIRLAPWPAVWIDIYPQSADAKRELLELLEIDRQQVECSEHHQE